MVYENGSYTIDFADFERRIVEEDVKGLTFFVKPRGRDTSFRCPMKKPPLSLVRAVNSVGWQSIIEFLFSIPLYTDAREGLLHQFC